MLKIDGMGLGYFDLAMLAPTIAMTRTVAETAINK